MGDPPHPSMDIYSLGVVAYEIISGVLPFSAKHAPHSQLHQKPRPLRTVTAEPVDERVEQLVMRMLQKDPASRHKDMGAVIFELKTVMNMLGFGPGRARRRTRRFSEGPGTAPVAASERTRQTLRAFELSPLPTALLNGDGIIQAANRSMTEFLGRGRRVEGEHIIDPMLLGIYPQFRADLRYIHITDQPYTRRLLVTRPDGIDMELFVHLTPGEKHLREVHMTILTPPHATE
jgi:PAS domain-containing protein